MPLEFRGFRFEYENIPWNKLSIWTYFVLAFGVFHIWMLLRALFRRQWIWLLIIFFFPVVGTVIYYFVSR